MTALALAAAWPAAPRVRAYTTLRVGGISTGRYASLNLAAHVGDEPRHVSENRRRLAAALALPNEPQWLEQVHGARVVDLDDAWSGPADAAVTGRRGVVCAVLTADCLPVLFVDRQARRVGVAHAGWRGLAAGVLGNTVAAMQTAPAELIAWLGPAIGPRAYEVGAEVRAAFLDRDPRADAAFMANSRGRWQADLYALARLELESLGLTGLHGGGFCTHDERERFFSHRREAPCGRLATLIWLEG